MPRPRPPGRADARAMPELPEVEHLRRSLASRLTGARIKNVELLRTDIVRRWPARRGNPAERLLAGSTVASLDRKGKQLAIVAESGHGLVVQLGMSGQVRWAADGAGNRTLDHVHARWWVRDRAGIAGVLEFRDPRRFGGLSPFESREDLDSRLWGDLGIDAVDGGEMRLGEVILAAAKGSRRPLKSLLLDQSVIAGIGNIYADEALFAAGLNPRVRAGRLDHIAANRLAQEVRRTLLLAIDSGGSTLRDYVDATGRSGSFQFAHRVYGRAGLDCLRCRQRLKDGVVAGRTTVWCPGCQGSARTRPAPHPSTWMDPRVEDEVRRLSPKTPEID